MPNRHFKTILFVIAGLLACIKGSAQPYGNEWIDYSKTYYKFKVGADGIYRISKSALDAAGVPSATAATSFVLYRNGQEVTVYTSTNGSFGGSDYIEFYGKKNDGFLDVGLFNLNQQSDDRISLFTDTAAYFLTIDNTTAHSRYLAINNSIPSASSIPYCLYTVGVYNTVGFLPGKSAQTPYQFYSSQFDDGEGYVDNTTDVSGMLPYTVSLPNLVNSGTASFNGSIISSSYFNNHSVRLLINNQVYADSSYGPAEAKKFNNIPVPASQLTATTEIKFQHYNTLGGYDQYGNSYGEIEYPRNLNLSGLDYFRFRLAASGTSQYIEFTNFNNGSGTPRLYDVTNKKYYTGDLSGSLTRFYIDPSFTTRELVLYASASSAIHAINAVKTINFTDFSQSSKQGNYLIISHPDLNQATAGHNYVTDYKNYRSSSAGGNHNVQIVDVTELYDQFAYGVDIHPLSVKRFLQFAYNTWTTVKPKDVFFIGRGMAYYSYRKFLQNRSLYPYTVVPTWGHPGSDVDFVNFLPGYKMAMNVGRLSAWNPVEIGEYLDKVKGYEAAIAPAVLPSVTSELWKKTALHLAGSSDIVLQTQTLLPTLNAGAAVIKDSFMGALVTTIAKSSTSTTTNVDSKTIDSMINNGLAVITFHGHASSGGFDFNLDDPDQYHNAPKVPQFLALGCDVSQIFDLTDRKTISEKYVASTGGSIDMIASSSLQFASFHSYYLPIYYHMLAQKDFGGTIGTHFRDANDSVYLYSTSLFTFAHLESMLLQGDPATITFGPSKPDLHVTADALSTIPVNVTTTLDSFKLKIVGYNLGRTTSDTIVVKVEHINPANVTTVVGTYKIYGLYATDTSFVNIPVDKVNDLGVNKYRVTIDAPGLIDELSEANNTATMELFIFSDNLIPVYPQEFAIVNKQGITLKASTLNPFRPVGKYKIEIDTTANFDSPLKQQTSITSPSGVIKWTPTLTYKDSTVYYWRTAFDSSVAGSYQWSTSSFIYLAQGSDGWNQSHYFQYKRDVLDSLSLDAGRKFKFVQSTTKVDVLNMVMVVDPATVTINGNIKQLSSCIFNNSIMVMVFDTISGQPWDNNGTVPIPATGAHAPCNPTLTRDGHAFEFSLTTLADRNNARHFIDKIPDGYYVLMMNLIYNPAYTPSTINTWKADSVANGNNGDSTLYQSIYRLGFTMVDSMYTKRSFVFLRQKARNVFPLYQAVTDPNNIGDMIKTTFDLTVVGGKGLLNSTVIGPAKQWNNLKWRSHTEDLFPQNDSMYVQVIGINKNNVETVLHTDTARDLSLSFADAAVYPKIRMIWFSRDTATRTTGQLDYWRVLYSPVPEAALNPGIAYHFNDSVQFGQPVDFTVAIENLTELPMDSMLVKYKIVDANSISHILGTKRYRKLPGNDTLHADFSFDPRAYPGKNAFLVEANPDDDQPEQYHPNNLGYLPLNVVVDNQNPLLDVTFDGMHILDKDIVSGKPFIKISLKDENKYLALDDTGLINVFLRYPGESQNISHKIAFDGTVCKFIPANTANGKNEAYIEYRPVLTLDSTYTLIVSAKDKTGNNSGGTTKTDYEISFNIYNKPAITRILNYPNPFSTATAFVFTLTGSEIPSQFKIQILTVTGKVVREITKAELGPLHIGRNITDYKWDGRDQYGQLLGNGVYLYRVVTTINGASLDQWKTASGSEEKFFKNGYGKMYIMR